MNQKLPLISYHGGHSAEFCDHAAEGSTTESIVRAYTNAGFKHFAITEHRPPDDQKFLYPDEIEKSHNAQFLQDRFSHYFDVVRPRIFDLFGDKAQIAFGFETEYYGIDPIGQTKELVDRYNPDLIVLSVHHVEDIPIDFSVDLYNEALRHCGSLDKLYQRYFDHQYHLISHANDIMGKKPAIIGHFDLIKLFANQNLATNQSFDFDQFSPELIAKIERNIKAAIDCGCVFEVNARAFKKGLLEPYPGRRILQIIKDKGGDITLGDDSHGPEQVGLFYEKSAPLIREYFDNVVAFEKQTNGDLKKVALPL